MTNSVFDHIKADAITQDNSAGHYLTQQAQRAALTRLPSFEQTTKHDVAMLKADNAALKRDVDQLYRLALITIALIMAIIAMGGVLCLL